MEAVEAFALVAGHVDEERLLRNEYLAVENEIPMEDFPESSFSPSALSSIP